MLTYWDFEDCCSNEVRPTYTIEQCYRWKEKKYRVSKKKKLHSRNTYKYINNDQNFKALTSIVKDNNSKIEFLNEVRYT